MSIIDRITIIKGDITKEKADAIVNAANTSLLGGGGVDGAIHHAAGPELLEECKKIIRRLPAGRQGCPSTVDATGLRRCACPTGEARITKGYNLPAKYVIHTVGPVWCNGKNNEAEMLARCYQSCFALADKHDIKSIAFPSISTGAYRFPVEKAAVIAVNKMKKLLEKYPSVKKVIVVCYDDKTYNCYSAIISHQKE